jgi:HprK-related kinase A
VDGQPFYDAVQRAQLIPLIEWTFNLSVFHRPCPHLLLHAAVVERAGGALIMPGAAGAGKSTLCAALVGRGWRLLSDEVAVIRYADGQLLPVPRPISLKEDSIELIRRFAPGVRLGPTWPETPKGRIAHLIPPLSSVRRMDEPARPAWLVFPTYEPGAAPELIPVASADAMMSCAEQGFNYSVQGAAGFLSLARLLDDCECYFFTYGDLDAAVRALEDQLLANSRLADVTHEPVR